MKFHNYSADHLAFLARQSKITLGQLATIPAPDLPGNPLVYCPASGVYSSEFTQEEADALHLPSVFDKLMEALS